MVIVIKDDNKQSSTLHSQYVFKADIILLAVSCVNFFSKSKLGTTRHWDAFACRLTQYAFVTYCHILTHINLTWYIFKWSYESKIVILSIYGHVVTLSLGPQIIRNA